VRRFLAKHADAIPVDGPLETPCLKWAYGINSDGYGGFWLGHCNIGAHRAAWLVFKDDDISLDMVIGHRCDFRACVNVLHLMCFSVQGNVDDMRAKGRDYYSLYGAHITNRVLTDEKVIAIHRLLKEGVRCVEIAKQFGVDHKTISSINLGYTWKHLLPDNHEPMPGQPVRGEEQWMAILNEDQARQVRKLAWEGSYTLREIGEMFGIATTTAWAIKHGRLWKHLWGEVAKPARRTLSPSPSATASECFRRF
jgi:transposase